MRSPISENSASVIVLDQLFKQADSDWPGVFPRLDEISSPAQSRKLDPEFSKFSLILAATAINLRAAFDVFPRHQAERIFICTMKLFEMQFTQPRQFHAIAGMIRRYMDAWNLGVTGISNPVHLVSVQLYEALGMKADKTGQPAPAVLEYLSRLLQDYSGKWENLSAKYEVLEEVK